MLSELQSLSGYTGPNFKFDPGSVTAPNYDIAGVSANAPMVNNPWAYTSWDQAGGVGNYLGANAPLFMGGLQALSGGIQAYTGLKGVNLAEKAFKQGKKEFNINLANQTQSYNTQVGDRISGRYYATEAERQAALAAAQLTDRSSFARKG